MGVCDYRAGGMGSLGPESARGFGVVPVFGDHVCVLLFLDPVFAGVRAGLLAFEFSGGGASLFTARARPQIMDCSGWIHGDLLAGQLPGAHTQNEVQGGRSFGSASTFCPINQ